MQMRYLPKCPASRNHADAKFILPSGLGVWIFSAVFNRGVRKNKPQSRCVLQQQMLFFTEEFGSTGIDMIRENDQVVLNIDIPEFGLAAGDIGSVAKATPGEPTIVVSFNTLKGDHVATTQLQRSEVRNVQEKEIAHVRGIVNSPHKGNGSGPYSRN